MAYINAEEIKVIRNNLKKEFPYVKFSVVGHNSTSVSVSILESPFEFYVDQPRRTLREITSFSVSHYNLSVADEERNQDELSDEGHPISYGPHETYVFLRKVNDIIRAKYWDESDSMTDYHNCAFYYDINIGRWDRSYVRTARPEGLAFLQDLVFVDYNLSSFDSPITDEARFSDPKVLEATADAMADLITRVFSQKTPEPPVTFPVYVAKYGPGAPGPGGFWACPALGVAYDQESLSACQAKGYKPMTQTEKNAVETFLRHSLEEYFRRLAAGTW